MPLMEWKGYEFVSQALPEETFFVTGFRGSEGISRLYEFDITLSSEEPDVDLKAVTENPALLRILREENDPCVFSGIVAEFDQLYEKNEQYFYRALLVPKLWLADLYRENQLFLDKTVPDIIEEILKQAGLAGPDYEMKLTKAYPKWEYMCQYRETDFDFISRWMEREGIYYYFEQTDGGEKMIITDTLAAHKDIPEGKPIYYHPPAGLISKEDEVLHSLTCRQRRLPQKVILKDYNYRTPSLELKGEAQADPRGQGTVYIYGEHFKTPGEGNALAKVRAEEILCREKIFYGESTAPTMCSGFKFQTDEHYRGEYNRGYLITELEHEGGQTGFHLASDAPGEKDGNRLGYRNNFVAIPDDIQFRPERKTPKPRFHGTINAKVDAAGDGQYAEIDDQGRYKVILPFDQSGRSGGKASRWVRMAQPYAGSEYGMHFPLHKDTEVLLSLVDGDPDRPIISASVPNPETASPVSQSNQTKSIIRTGGGNEIHFEDKKGKELLFTHAKKDKEFLIENELKETVKSHAKSFIMGKLKEIVNKQVTKLFKRNCSKTVLGTESHVVIGNHVEKVGGNFTQKIGGDNDRKVGGDFTREIDGNYKQEVKGNYELKVGGEMTIEAKGKITIKGSEIHLNP